jgi:hypothetical protein
MLKQLRSTLFVKLTIGSFRLGETVKSSESFIHCLNYNLAATVSERI